jgi:hypothetical protein
MNGAKKGKDEDEDEGQQHERNVSDFTGGDFFSLKMG